MLNQIRQTFRKGLRRRLLAVNGAFLLISSMSLATIFFIQARATLREEFSKRGVAVTQILAHDTWMLLRQDAAGTAGSLPADETAFRPDLAREVEALCRDEDVAYALVEDPEGVPLFSATGPGIDLQKVFGKSLPVPNALDLRRTRSRNFNGHDIFDFSVPICWNHQPHIASSSLDGGDHAACRLLGTVRIGLSTTGTLSQINRAFALSLLLGLGLGGLGILGIVFSTRWTLQPVVRIAEMARAITKGDLATQVEVSSDDEIGELATAFNEMSWSLADSREELGRRNEELQMVAAEKERLYQNTRIRATRLEVMNELAKAMASSLNAEEIYNHVHRQLSRLMEYEYLTVQRYLPETQRFRRDHVWIDRPSEDLRVGEEVEAENSPLRRVQRTKMPLSMPDFSKDKMMAGGWLHQQGFQSGFVVPIVARGEFLGILGLACRRPNAFARMEVATVFAIADTLAVVLKNAELYTAVQTSYAELQEAQNRLAKSENVRRAEKLRTVGQMASGTAHNFNNILSSIIGRVQFLRLKSDRGAMEPAEVLDCLGVIERAALDGSETVRRLQEFSRGPEVDPTHKADLNEIVRGVIEITRPRWKDQTEQRGIRIHLETDLKDMPPVACVPSEIREALTNLIFNAVDAMPEGGTISIATWKNGERAALELSDTGVGMPEEVRERVFDPFYSTKGVKGSGLGLSTVFGIVERHQGEVTVRSKLGEGSTFRIELPLAPPDARRRVEEQMMHASPWVILVGDDEPAVREALSDLLTLLGHQVVQANCGTETVELFKTREFDMVFTDLGMPDMSGWEVTEHIRAINPDIPIVLATGWGTQIPEADARSRGVTRVLPKPFTVQKISSLIAELQGLREAA